MGLLAREFYTLLSSKKKKKNLTNLEFVSRSKFEWHAKSIESNREELYSICRSN